MMRALVVVSLLDVVGCGSKAPATSTNTTPTTPVVAAVPADVTSWYVGTGDVLGMDGTVYVKDSPTLVERTVSPARKTITETVYVAMQHAMVTSTLTQTADPQVFEATDALHSFSGTLTYDGDPWNPTGWTYDITLADNAGKITGTAKFGADEISAEKLFTSGDGTPTARIVDVARKVSKEEFLARRKEVTGE